MRGLIAGLVVLLVLGVGFFLWSSPTAAPAEMTEAEIAQIEAEVGAAVSAFIQAVLQLDADEAMEFWADTERFALAGDGVLVSDFDEWAPGYRENYDNFVEALYFEPSDPQILVLSPDAASYSMAFEWSLINTEGDTINSHGSWLYVMKYIDGRWRTVQSAGTHLYE
jgi:hypothetical protein